LLRLRKGCASSIEVPVPRSRSAPDAFARVAPDGPFSFPDLGGKALSTATASAFKAEAVGVKEPSR
jgi:hypothetical protein